MIFPIDDLVARLSAVCPLLPGDLIFTGTPAGRATTASRPSSCGPARHW
jgi:2-keto-4-pentenoate hydratase/2-oxohepta-3-ene-1,7-dioic acid hydratase in catechol pathway